MAGPENPGLVVVAIGGNALGSNRGRPAASSEWSAARKTAQQIAQLSGRGLRLVVTHGNGPQVGRILRQSELASAEIEPIGMAMAVAHTQGAIGFMLGRALEDAFSKQGSDRVVAALITEALVDPKDPAFGNPTKPIGSYMTAAVAKQRQAEMGWAVRDFGTPGWRRIVASPVPHTIVQIEAIRALVAAGVVVIAGGGGGVPVVRRKTLTEGIAAVIDKDLVSSLLARQLNADAFVIATNVEQVALNYGTSRERPLENLTVAAARRHLADAQFGAGSMSPKVQAMVEFVEACPASQAVITRLDRIAPALEGKAGTRFLA